jgi:membrane protease YdiL (CAAX protease family)
MTALRDMRSAAPMGFALLLLLPSAAIGGGVLSFDYRFEALLLVFLTVIGLCAIAGFTAAELGLTTPVHRRHWAGAALITAVLLAFVVLEADVLDAHRPAPNWMLFAPFYVLVSCPLQEVVCRAIPKLIADRLDMSGVNYVLFSSGVFSLMHAAYGDTLLLANTFFAGLAWSAAYLVTRNIWPLALSHAAVGLYAFSLGVA